MAVLLALVTMALYWPATNYDFVNYDDLLYVKNNPHIQAGLTWEGLSWAFGQVHGKGTYWHPLTWVSHMMDCQLYGLNPRGHHLTSVLLHAVNVVLVFLVFRRMTGAFWRGAVLAAFFALHPLQVDSVAWVAERKNLLSALFWLLATGAYVRYAEKPVVGNRGSEARSRASGVPPADHEPQTMGRGSLFYLLSLFFFTLGLMCKPVLVTLPFALLLLDYWPLRRLQFSSIIIPAGTLSQGSPPCPPGAASCQPSPPNLRLLWSLLREKLPFIILALASSAITLIAHHALGILDSVSSWSWDTRIENALVSYVRYLGKSFWPSHLAVFYPYPDAWPLWQVVACGLLLLVISGLVLVTARSSPWLFVGWCWFLGVLVPFIGLIQAGAQAMADRFMYLPVIGIMLAVIWGSHGLAKGGRYQQAALTLAGAVAIFLCGWSARRQLGYWRDSEALFRHALEVTENNYLAHNNLGDALDKRGQTDEAIPQFLEAIRLQPGYDLAHNNLGLAFYKKGQTEEAISQYQEALRLRPDNAEAHNNLGLAFYKKGQTDEAIGQYQEALRLRPDHADAHNNLGLALAKKGQTDEAISQYQEALRLKPNDADARNNLGIALDNKGQIDEAIRQYQEALRLKPDAAEAHYNLGNALDNKGQIDEAISQYQEVLRLKPDAAEAYYNLGNAFIKKGRIDEAIRQYQEALRLKPGDAETYYNLGTAFHTQGRIDEAIRQYREALRLKPDYAEAHNNLGTALDKQGQTDEAIRQFQEALRLKPSFFQAHLALAQILPRAGRLKDAAFHMEEFLRTCPTQDIEALNSPVRGPAAGALNDLAWFLATRQSAEDRDGVRAVRFAERACELTDRRIAVLMGTLAAAYAEAGRFKEAIESAQQAQALAQAAGQIEIAERNRQLLELYRSGQPYHQPPPDANNNAERAR